MLLWEKHGTRPPNVALPRDFVAFVDAGLAFVGTPEMVREAIEQAVAASGINYLLCRFAFGDLPYEAARRSVDLFIGEVMGGIAA